MTFLNPAALEKPLMDHHNDRIRAKSIRYKDIVDAIISGQSPSLTGFAEDDEDLEDFCDNCDACFDAHFYRTLITGFSSGKSSADQVKQDMQRWRYSKLHDEALAGLARLPRLVFARTPATTSAPLAYLDQSIFSIAARESDYFLKLMALKGTGIGFVHSPSHAEEIAKIAKPEDRSRLIDVISRLTDNMSLQPDTGGRSIKTFLEAPEIVVSRVDNTRKASDAVERMKTLKDEDRALYFRHYDAQDRRRSLGNTKDIFESMDDAEFSRLTHASGFSQKSDFKNMKDHNRIRSAVYALHDAMDLMAYKQDKADRQQRSSVHDIEHLIYASCCRYFATNDSNLKARAEEIYRFMALPVLVLGKDDIFSIATPPRDTGQSGV
ncbi:hypothetical protein [Lysobacter hankyongensis]